MILYVTQGIISRPAGTRVWEIINHFHDIAAKLDVVMYVYLVDADGSLQGVVDLRDLLNAEPEQQSFDIMSDNLITLGPEDTLHDAVEFFPRYSFRAIPVTDEKKERPG